MEQVFINGVDVSASVRNVSIERKDPAWTGDEAFCGSRRVGPITLAGPFVTRATCAACGVEYAPSPDGPRGVGTVMAQDGSVLFAAPICDTCAMAFCQAAE